MKHKALMDPSPQSRIRDATLNWRVSIINTRSKYVQMLKCMNTLWSVLQASDQLVLHINSKLGTLLLMPLHI